MKQKLLLTLLCLVFAMNGKASDSGYDFEVGRFRYNIISSEESIVELISSPTEKYSGSITIPEMVSNDGKTYRVGRIAENAFSNCTELTEVIMSNNIESIGMNAFMGCTALVNVKLSENIDELYHGVFAYCTSLKEIVIPDNVKTLYGQFGNPGGIWPSTFEDCTSLETVTLGRRLQYVSCYDRVRGMFSYEYNPFVGCTSLKKVIIRSEVVAESITQTLRGSVEEITLENTVREFEDEAFTNFKGLKHIVVRAKSIGDETFKGCSDLTDLILSEGLESIGTSAFYNCSSLLKVDIPKSVKSIGGSAFGNCTFLARITVGDSIVSMGSNPFTNTRWYNNRPDGEIYIGKVLLAYRAMPENTTLKVKDGTVCIADYALNNSNNLDSLYIPSSVVYVGNGICVNCKSLQYVDLPDELKTISANSFYGCEKLSTVEWPGNLDLIGGAAFSGCKSLNTLNLPNTVIAIGDNAFYGCESLKEVNLPQSLKEIGESAFSSCPMYENVVIPGSVVSIGANAFSDSWSNRAQKRVTIPQSVEFIDETAFANTALTYLNIDSDYLVEQLPSLCASSSSAPTEIVFGDNATTIVPSVMENSKSLKSVMFGTNVKEIGDFAFCGCTSLSEVVFLTKDIPTLGMDCFLNLAKNCKIYVPDPESYRNAWPEYAHMIVDIAGLVDIKEQVFTYTGHAPELTYTSKVPVNVVFEGLMTDAGTYEAEGKALFALGSDTVEKAVDCIYTITKAPLYVVAADTSRVYGEENPEFQISLYGFVNGEDSTVLTSFPTAYSDASVESNVGEYTIYAVGGEAKNYEFVHHTAVLTVEKAEQAIIWELESDTVIAGTQLELNALATSGLQVTYAQYDAFDETISELNGLYMDGGKCYLDCRELGVLHILAVQDGMMGDYENYQMAYTIKRLVVVEPERYALTLLIDGEVYWTDSLAEGATITLPETPVKEGHTFSGWGEVPETMPAEDVAISGFFTVNKYLVTFVIDDEVIASDSLEYGASIVAPIAPEKEGHTFNGWGEVAETVPAEDVTYYGSYSVNSYLLTYVVDGETVQSDSVAYGTAIVALEEPTKEGYTFSGWSEIPETMPAEDVTISGTFTVNTYKVYYYVGDELVHTAEVAYGEAIPEYVYEPTAEGDVFVGWVGETYETMPAHDVTYTANIESGIEEIENSKLGIESSVIYDLHGRKIQVDDLRELERGVYIIDNKKVVIK